MMDFLVPKLSATMEEATVLKWLKRPGEAVKLGEPIVELETDKAAMEVESPADGTLAAIAAAEGASLPIGALLAEIATPSDMPGAARASAARVRDAAGTASRASEATRPSSSRPHDNRDGGKGSGRILASPLARRLAGDLGVDLASLAAGGRRLRKADVLRAAEALRSGGAVGKRAGSPRSDSPEPLSAMRAGIAETVALSRRTIPSYSLDRWVSLTAIEAATPALGAATEREHGVRLTLTDFLLQALADALVAEPRLLQRWAEGAEPPARLAAGSVDIGLIVALPDGMMVPVVADLGGRSLAEVALARRAAVQRARAGRLAAADATPVAVALSNLARSGADRFEAIVAPGQTAVLAVGRRHQRVVARGGAPAIETGVQLTLSVDHRLIDGIVGAAFLAVLSDRIEFGPWG